MDPRAKGGFSDNPQNINRKGRPKKRQSVTELLDETVDKHTLVQKLIELATEKDDIAALRYAIDRLDGKPTETVHNLNQQLPDVIEIDLSDDSTDSSS